MNTSVLDPWMMEERFWLFGTTAWTKGRPSLTTWHTNMSFNTWTWSIINYLLIKWITRNPTCTKGRSLDKCSKIFGGTVSRRACRLTAFSAVILEGWGSWRTDNTFPENTCQMNGEFQSEFEFLPWEADMVFVQSCWWCLPRPSVQSH